MKKHSTALMCLVWAFVFFVFAAHSFFFFKSRIEDMQRRYDSCVFERETMRETLASRHDYWIHCE